MFNFHPEVFFKLIISYLRKSYLDNKMQQFQWKISHKGLYTGSLLHDINPDRTPLCTFCKHTEETIIHIFAKCNITTVFWNWIFDNLNFVILLTESFVYINSYEEMTKLYTLVTVLGKHTIWEMLGILLYKGSHNRFKIL